MSKTVDEGVRLVLSAPDLKVETLDDIMVTMDYSAEPLAAVLVNFKPFILFNVKRFFENEFSDGIRHQVIQNGKIIYEEIKDPLITFSEENIEAQMKKFIHGYSNRFEPVEIPLVSGKTGYMVFKGHHIEGSQVLNKEAIGASPLIERRMTWLDVFFIAAEDAVRDKVILITRFPVNCLPPMLETV